MLLLLHHSEQQLYSEFPILPLGLVRADDKPTAHFLLHFTVMTEQEHETLDLCCFRVATHSPPPPSASVSDPHFLVANHGLSSKLTNPRPRRLTLV